LRRDVLRQFGYEGRQCLFTAVHGDDDTDSQRHTASVEGTSGLQQRAWPRPGALGCGTSSRVFERARGLPGSTWGPEPGRIGPHLPVSPALRAEITGPRRPALPRGGFRGYPRRPPECRMPSPGAGSQKCRQLHWPRCRRPPLSRVEAGPTPCSTHGRFPGISETTTGMPHAIAWSRVTEVPSTSLAEM